MGRITIAFGVFAIFSAVSASAADFPVRKAGLWEITITGRHPFKVRQCSDPTADKAMMQAGLGFAGKCGTPAVQESGNTITVASVCKSAGKTTISDMVITGSLQGKYTMTVMSHAPGASGGQMMTLHGEWLGPCTAGDKPGDVIMPNGTKINLLQSAPTHGAHER